MKRPSKPHENPKHDPPPETRASLIARICDSSNDDAWSEFVRIYQPVVERFIQRHGLQYADAVEVTQEVLSRVAHSIESWDGDRQDSSFRGWLYRITRNRTIDFLRKRRLEKAMNSMDAGGLSQVADSNPCCDISDSSDFQAEYEKELFRWAAAKIQPSFKPSNWKAFWRSTVDGLPIDQVARELNMDCGAVYVARSRIMARLSKMIQERMNETQGLPEDAGWSGYPGEDR